MSPLECYILYLKDQHIGYVSDIWSYAACDGSCPVCPASPACRYISESNSNSPFSENFETYLMPFKDEYSQLTLQHFEQTNPEYFI